ncbi:MAG: pseudouridine synthase [Pseudomonadota bacterium]
MFQYDPPEVPFLEFIFRDEHVAVMHKPHGLLSVPGKAAEHRDSLHYRLSRTLPTATVVHRLDMATSGIIVFALNKEAHRHISKQFENREVKKTYNALVHGLVEDSHGAIELPLRCDWPNRPKQMVDHKQGKHALTHYSLEDQKTTDKSEPYTLVELSPITGRSHQLRVHLNAIGHPILGDRLYAHPQALNMASRLCLHATYLSFTHPHTGRLVEFSCKLSLTQFLN